MVVIDSDIIMWLLRGKPEVMEEFKKTLIETDGNIFITPVQVAEIYAGILPKEKTLVEGFLSSLNVISITEKTGKLAGEFMNKYGKSHNVSLADALVAAASRLSGYELWTKNRKHYPMLEAEEFFRE